MARRIKFTNKRTSKKALISLNFSVFTLLWVIISLNLTSRMGEGTPRVVGGLSMLCFILQIVAIVLAARALKDEDVFIQLPIAALVCAVLFEAALIAFFIIGLVGIVA